MTTALLDTHVLHWWSTEADRLSPRARQTVEDADELAVAGISWYELAWLAAHGRILVSAPVLTWLSDLSSFVRTVGVTPSIADRAAGLPATFLGDPADRLIYATALEYGWPLVTKDGRMRGHPNSRATTVW
ncbi:MAG TPA: PIN domain-containing protein [Actinomycetota bacterium]|nr:PIN domain-containing protein [Actinomycetota bacterium]